MAVHIATVKGYLSKIDRASLLANSISRTVCYYAQAECVERIAAWENWHSHWVYNEQTTGHAANGYPMRSDIIPLAVGN